MGGPLVLAGTFGWPDVAVAFVTAVPAALAAWASLSNRQSLKTPSGTSVGKQIENAHHVALANNYRLQALGDGFDVPMPAKAAEEEARVEALNEVQTKAERQAKQNG